jgi:hypothetical protein
MCNYNEMTDRKPGVALERVWLKLCVQSLQESSDAPDLRADDNGLRSQLAKFMHRLFEVVSWRCQRIVTVLNSRNLLECPLAQVG